MDEKILAYRSELQKRSENTPFWTRTILTVEEAAAYTGIGRDVYKRQFMRLVQSQLSV